MGVGAYNPSYGEAEAGKSLEAGRREVDVAVRQDQATALQPG